jgi:hypothetical protein
MAKPPSTPATRPDEPGAKPETGDAAPAIELRGIDFSSRPTRRKPIVLACGRWEQDAATDAPGLRLTNLRALPTPAAYAAALAEPGPWVAGCDLPFGLPRELVEALGWPMRWPELIDHYAALDRATIRATFAAFCAARPAGAKFAHRACDRPAGSSPSMKWVNPPVAYMLHAGVPPLRAAGCELPGLAAGDPSRKALEAYPGLLARELIGRTPYKSDERARQSAEQAQARERIVSALETGDSRLGLRLVLDRAQRAALVADPQGDALDATLCLLQAAWASRQPNWGWPAGVDALEGWILTA